VALTGTASRLTAGERAREPRHLGVVAYFDGYARAYARSTRYEYPRRLLPDEAASWREGWLEGWTERVCHAWHGFIPCEGDHPARLPDIDG
jgi:hypothetical protein